MPLESLAVPQIVKLVAVVEEPFLGEAIIIDGTEPPELTTPAPLDPPVPLLVTRTTRETECSELSAAVMVIMLAPEPSGTAAVQPLEPTGVARPDFPLL